MRNRNLPVIAGQRGCHCGRCIALYDNLVWQFFINNGAKSEQHTCDQCIKRLPGLHNIQIKIWNDTADVEDLIEQVAVLSGHTDPNVGFSVFAQFVDHWEQLDGFRTSAEYDENA